MARYEERLYIKDPDGDTEKDENGDYKPGGDLAWTLLSDCRDEPSDKGRQVANVDGESIEYSSIIQLPEDCPEIGSGVEVQVRNADGKVVFEGKAIRFKTYRKNCRLWV